MHRWNERPVIEPEPVNEPVEQAVIETTNDTDANVEAQKTGLSDISPAATSQTGAIVRPPFSPNPRFADMARKLRGA